MLRKPWLLIGVASIAVTSSALACDGEACRDIAIKTDPKGCVLVQNRGMRAVRVRLGIVNVTVRGGETAYPKDTTGGCLTRYFGSERATYTN